MECKGHTGPVCALDAIYVEESNILVASAASDSTVRLWLCSEAKEGKKNNPNYLLKYIVLISLQILQFIMLS